jgi:hypothetical protein
LRPAWVTYGDLRKERQEGGRWRPKKGKTRRREKRKGGRKKGRKKFSDLLIAQWT